MLFTGSLPFHKLGSDLLSVMSIQLASLASLAQNPLPPYFLMTERDSANLRMAGALPRLPNEGAVFQGPHSALQAFLSLWHRANPTGATLGLVRCVSVARKTCLMFYSTVEERCEVGIAEFISCFLFTSDEVIEANSAITVKHLIATRPLCESLIYRSCAYWLSLSLSLTHRRAHSHTHTVVF